VEAAVDRAMGNCLTDTDLLDAGMAVSGDGGRGGMAKYTVCFCLLGGLLTMEKKQGRLYQDIRIVS